LEKDDEPNMKLLELLRLPETGNIEDIDDPAITLLHGEIIRRKPFLRKLYRDFYREFQKAIPEHENKVIVEVGSGGGFLKEVISNATTSDVFDLPDIDMVFSALEMPFEESSIDAILMLDVLHHLPDPRAFFKEAVRCLKPSGKVIMIEPANTLWSRFIYMNFHHELFDTNAGWGPGKTGPLSQGNGAIPWIIFRRDRKIYEKEFPTLRIIRTRRHTPLRYLLSGGFTLRQLAPSFTYPLLKFLELMLSPANALLAMFETTELQKTSGGADIT